MWIILSILAVVAGALVVALATRGGRGVEAADYNTWCAVVLATRGESGLVRPPDERLVAGGEQRDAGRR